MSSHSGSSRCCCWNTLFVAVNTFKFTSIPPFDVTPISYFCTCCSFTCICFCSCCCDPCERQHPFGIGCKDFQICFVASWFLVCDSSLQKGAQWSYRSVLLQESSARLLMAMQSLDQEDPPYTSACPRLSSWWINYCSVGEGSNGCVGYWPRRVVGGCSGCKLVARDSFVPWYPQEGFPARSNVGESLGTGIKLP